jgi:hypothetical protein
LLINRETSSLLYFESGIGTRGSILVRRGIVLSRLRINFLSPNPALSPVRHGSLRPRTQTKKR